MTERALTAAEVEAIADRVADRSTRETLRALGVDVDNPLQAQRDFAVMRDVGRMAMDAEFRKDLEHARKWRLALAEADGPAADIAHSRRWRKLTEAAGSKSFLTTVAFLASGAISQVVLGAQSVLRKFGAGG
jgi:hypothetical protein